MLQGLVRAFRWIGKHWAISLAVVLIVAIGVTTAVCWHFFGDTRDDITIYVSVSGMGEGYDMENRAVPAKENDSLFDTFSREKVQEEFKGTLIMNNVFRSFMGVQATSAKSFYVKIDGVYEGNLTQAYIRDGSKVEIEYR